MRTRAEVRAYLDALVGTIVVNKGDSDYNGQCVTLTKALMEFLGVPNPYAARGDAINAGDTYIRQGIGTSGRGWLTICVNRDMGYIGGVHYGHIWIDLLNEANYESNGARALYTTKNTRPVTQAQQFVNFDKWIGDEEMPIQDTDNEYARWRDLGWRLRGRELSRGEFRASAVGKTWLKAIEILSDDVEANVAQGWQNVGQTAVRDNWAQQIYDLQDVVKALDKRPTQKQLDDMKAAADQLAEQARQSEEAELEAEQKAAAAIEAAKKAQEEIDRLKAQEESDKAAGDSLMRRIGQWISKYLPGEK